MKFKQYLKEIDLNQHGMIGVSIPVKSPKIARRKHIFSKKKTLHKVPPFMLGTYSRNA